MRAITPQIRCPTLVLHSRGDSVVPFEIAIHDAAQPLGIALVGIKHREFDQLIADQSGAAVHGPGKQALELGVRLGARHEEGAGLVERIEPLEVEVAAI